MPVITLNNGRSFVADPAMTILDAARAQGVVLEYSCRMGRCGMCKAPAIGGETAILRSEHESLTAAEVEAGLILTCCRAAQGNVALDVEPLDRLADIAIRTIPARIVSLDRLAPDIIKVVLKTPPASPLRYLPGQYVDVIARGVRRSYSLANAPRAGGLLELLVKRYPGGALSGYWFENARANDLLRIEGPFGTFFLRDGQDGRHARHIVFLATGTGIAPIKAILEELAADRARAERHRISIFWGNRHSESFCWDPGALALDFGFHYLLSGPSTAWSGKRGHVQDAAIHDGIDVDETVVYACGSSAMIASARTGFSALGLPGRRFFSDAFVSSN